MKYVCEQCKNTFQAPPCQNARFCGRSCYDKSREGWFNCEFCKKKFRYYKSHKRGKLIYCSQKCQMTDMKGSKHAAWKGKGYRIIFEEFIGRKLRTGEIIHHINGDHSDNRAENMIIVTRAEHADLHRENSPFVKGHKQFNTGRTWFKPKA